MIYYCLLLIASAWTGIATMFSACLKRQGYLITFILLSWNIIRFFIFSFFLYGAAFGIIFFMIRVQPAFNSEDEWKFLYKCLFKKETKFLNETIKASIIFFSLKIKMLNVKISAYNITACNLINDNIGNEQLGSFDCGF